MALKIFLKQESLPGHLHHLQHWWQIGILAGSAVCNGTLLSPLLWGQGQVIACLHPFESTQLWLCMAEASGETGSLSSYCMPHGETVPLLHNVGEKKITHPQFRVRSKPLKGLKLCKLLRGDNPGITLAVQVLQRFGERPVACSLH